MKLKRRRILVAGVLVVSAAVAAFVLPRFLEDFRDRRALDGAYAALRRVEPTLEALAALDTPETQLGEYDKHIVAASSAIDQCRLVMAHGLPSGRQWPAEFVRARNEMHTAYDANTATIDILRRPGMDLASLDRQIEYGRGRVGAFSNTLKSMEKTASRGDWELPPNPGEGPGKGGGISPGL